MPSFASSSSSSPLPPAAASAVAALEAAGTDLDALASAIGTSAFLDETPGSARQALRAARTRLRKALADAAAKAKAAAASAAADASPFARPAYEASEFAPLSQAFESLPWRAIAKPGGATVRPDPYYELFALRAQSDQGDVAGERPMWAERGGLDFDGRARWDARAALKGLSAEEARLRFVKLYWEFSPRALYSEGRGGKK